MYSRTVTSPDPRATSFPPALPVKRPSASLASPPASSGGAGVGLWTGLIALLSFPWAVHAIVVTLSAFGAQPLSGRLSALSIVVASAAFTLAVSRVVAKRAQR